MKNLILTFVFTFGLLLVHSNATNAECTSQHTCNGCTINFTQSSTGWSYDQYCDGEFQGHWEGECDYEGTFCGGEEPCNVPMSEGCT